MQENKPRKAFRLSKPVYLITLGMLVIIMLGLLLTTMYQLPPSSYIVIWWCRVLNSDTYSVTWVWMIQLVFLLPFFKLLNSFKPKL